MSDTPTASHPRPDLDRFGLSLPSVLAERPEGHPFDPPRELVRLSGQAPVHRIATRDGAPVWVITGMAECRAALADARLSSDILGHPAVREKLLPHVRERLLDERARAGSFITMDAPRHTRYRKLLTGQFTVRRMKQLVPRVHQIVTDQLDAMIAQGPPADLVRDFALPVPSLVICELLGVDYADRAEFQERSAKVLRVDLPVEELLEAGDGLRAFMHELVRHKRERPADDILSGLVHSAAEPPLDDDELVGIANLLLVAGHETTANMLALGTFALLRNPEQLAALRADPSLVDGAVEELLRYLSIVHLGINRVTTQEVRIGDEVIPEGATVVVSVPLANRDARQYADPDELDVTRPRGAHIAFGHGIHQCLGQQLARVEMAVGFTELLRRLPGLRLEVEPERVPMRSQMIVYGVHSLPVSWDG
ncbi:cytochrome P450 [Saccharothrix coeruleofusca]|uniref:Cytochrome P450 n=1 Tax=Saccharothrix coeruleofusca TaxID=33919 RepID=A0A918ALW4_9PSEU|nr:cytochrome P450 [Saccharothrix coeruleofusca]GGP54329.1 cytochrome P450 [Saccharothrix coeruleofusca]